MRIANAVYDGDRKLAAAKTGGPWLDITHVAGSVQCLLDSGQFSPELIAGVDGPPLDPAKLRFQAPFQRPGQIIALARNYTAHAQESTLPVPNEPIFFSKSNTSVIGPEEPVVLPPNLGRIEPEIELAIVIAKKALHVPASAASEFIAGYTILNDVSAQELQSREIREGYPLFRCKSLPTFTPMGPYIVTVDEAGIEPALGMTLRVNGTARVTTNTSGLTFGVARLIEFISGYVALYPGDIITTGCPKAAGAICPGDLLELEIERLGVLRNPVVAGTEPCPA
ncbi:MAG TPA: fumarylacetoacetate hydrolase family protein [Bryobacteraceae bacterium]|nr:fumarylacetoacetate hydrolase family protein [Bryobacteraceae bacterium]